MPESRELWSIHIFKVTELVNRIAMVINLISRHLTPLVWFDELTTSGVVIPLISFDTLRMSGNRH